ncbi:MAG: beta-N-acetylhexosaminidase [Bacteroidales bacterium]
MLCLLGNLNLKAQEVNIIPAPQEVKMGEGTFTINNQTKIAYTTESKSTAEVLQSNLNAIWGYQVGLAESADGNIKFELNKNLGTEAYELVVAKSGIQIKASTGAGWFYGVQSLLQLIPTTDSKEKVSSINIPLVSIKDSPRFKWRAFMLDEGRYFKGIEMVKQLLDEMARLKMNTFHWHLTDDQGWRIEIKKYPLLTEIGSKRKSTQIGPLKWQSEIQSAEPHSGFYTQEQIKEVVKYAQDRHITVVPEIEMPGHSSAAIAAYSWLGTNKKEIEVPIKFGVGTDVYDVSDPKVYQFLTDVLDEVMALFPSKVIHIGGDEVKYNHWKESESVQAYMKKNNLKSPAELQVFFTNRISHYLNSKGRRMMGWNEIMGHNLHEYQDAADTKSDQRLAEGTVVHFWKGNVKLATQAASTGFDIVYSLHTDTYLDYTYDRIPLSKSYSYDPIPADLDPKFHDKVIGTGCQMWSEWTPTKGNIHFQAFPRIAAYAEVGWTEKENKNYEHFKVALQNLEEIWKQEGIYFAPNSVVDPAKKKK